MENINRCPNCGGKLQLSKNRRSMICPYCDSEFLLDQAGPAAGTGAPAPSLLDPDRYILKWDYDYVTGRSRDIKDSVESFIYCANELVGSADIRTYIRNRYLNGDEVAGEGYNEHFLTDIRRRISGDMLPDEQILFYGNTGIFSKGKEGLLLTNKRFFFIEKKKYLYLLHKDIHSVKLDTALKISSYHLNENYEYNVSNISGQYKLQGAMLALAFAYTWEADPRREPIEILS